MTLQDIVTAVRGKLQDDNFDQTLITNAANWFVNDLFSTNAMYIMEESDELFASAGDTEVDLPDDWQTFIWEGLNVVVPQVYNMKQYFMEYGDFMQRFPNYAGNPAQNLAYWTVFGTTVRFSAPLLVDTQINIDYIRVPNTMVNLTDTCEVPDTYQEMVVLGALARCMQTNEDYPEAAQELANLAPLRTTFIANNARGQQKTGPVIMRSNRRGTNIREGGWGN